MSNFFFRIRRGWRAFNGKWDFPKPPQTVYIEALGNPNRFVHLVVYQDLLLGLAADGTVYRMDREWIGSRDSFVMQLMFESPQR